MYENTPQDLSHNLTVRIAKENDSAEIWKWRNDALARQMSTSKDEVSWEAHSIWFNNCLKNKNCYFYIGIKNATKKIGMCRFDIDAKKNMAKVSININPDFRNKNISRPLLQKAIEAFTAEKDIDLIAKIKKINTASIKCFCSCNFLLENEDKTYSYFRLIGMPSNDIQNKLKLIDEIEKIRTANNVNWMDLLRLAFIKSPEETKLLIRKINADDNKISSLFAKLGE